MKPKGDKHNKFGVKGDGESSSTREEGLLDVLPGFDGEGFRFTIPDFVPGFDGEGFFDFLPGFDGEGFLDFLPGFDGEWSVNRIPGMDGEWGLSFDFIPGMDGEAWGFDIMPTGDGEFIVIPDIDGYFGSESSTSYDESEA